MTTVDALAAAARAAFDWAVRQPDVVEVEVFAAENAHLLCRLNYTSHLPSNGVEEPKSTAAHGLGVQAVFRRVDGPALGFGSETGDLTLAGVERALAKARRTAVVDPQFVSLPEPSAEPRTLVGYHDPRLLTIDDDTLVQAGWRVVQSALSAFRASGRLAERAGSEAALPRLGLIVGGDVTILQERIAVLSTRMPAVQTDESALITAAVTAMVEAEDAKGTGWSTDTRLDDFTGEAGAEAAERAIEAIGGDRVPSGRHAVIFGPQPVAELLSNLVLPAVRASAFYASSTPFLGKLGRRVAVPDLTVYDDGAQPGLMGSKGITCEGLPTGRTDLVRDGVLVGCLTSWYEARRLLADRALSRKLGVDGEAAARALVARNGFRFGGGGRAFDRRPGTSASNVIVEGRTPLALPALLARVQHGLLVGRIWYCYAINGLAAGDFTCTVVGDSYIIRDGRIAAPLRANAIRIDDNITRILEHVIGVGTDRRGTVLWAADEVVYAPSIAVSGVAVSEIASASAQGDRG